MLFYKIGAVLAAVLGFLGSFLQSSACTELFPTLASQKTHEIGVRMALGAQPWDILGMIFREGLLIVAVGLALGIAGALAAGRVVGSFLTVSAHDPVTYVFVVGVLAIVALAACFIPARRAMRVDPMVALRYE